MNKQIGYDDDSVIIKDEIVSPPGGVSPLKVISKGKKEDSHRGDFTAGILYKNQIITGSEDDQIKVRAKPSITDKFNGTVDTLPWGNFT